MNFKINEVQTIKLSNGDELIAKIAEIQNASITVVNPLTVLPSSQGIQLLPSLFTSDLDCSVQINISNITMVADARDQVTDSYLEATTGIKPVRSQILTG
jgi:hypothetical protein